MCFETEIFQETKCATANFPFQKILFQRSKCTESEDMCTVKLDHGGAGGCTPKAAAVASPTKPTWEVTQGPGAQTSEHPREPNTTMTEQRECFRDTRVKTHGTLTRALAESLRVDRTVEGISGVDRVLKEMGNNFDKAVHRAVTVVMGISGGQPQGMRYVATGKKVEFEPVEAAKLFKDARKGVNVRVSTKYLTKFQTTADTRICRSHWNWRN